MAKRLAEAIIRFANSLKTQYNDLSMFSKVFIILLLAIFVYIYSYSLDM